MQPLSPERSGATLAIVDYGMGNLFSVQRACQQAGLQAAITSSAQEVLLSQAVILPGVGAFGDAMATLRRLGLIEALREIAASGKPMLGICLGMQLLMTESEEFGRHAGLGILEGSVVRLRKSGPSVAAVKIPHVGWNRIARTSGSAWEGTLLEGLPNGAWMYFVHSFYVQPEDWQVACAVTQYGPVEFCSSLRKGNVFACQFHPERSGPGGLRIYANFAARVLAQGNEAMTPR